MSPILGLVLLLFAVAYGAVAVFAYRNWGYVDLTVGASNRFFSEDAAAQLASKPEVRRVTDGVAAGIEAYGSTSDLTTRQGTSGVTLVGFDPAAQKPFGAYTLLSGRRTYGIDLLPGQVLLSRVLADKLNARAGDRLALGREGQGATASDGASRPGSVELRVAGIAKLEGPGGYTLSSVVFAPLVTAQRLLDTDQINVIRISTPGGISDSGPAAEAAAPVLRRAVKSLDAGLPLTVTEAKAREADAATANTVFIRALLIGMSALVVAAGAALVVNLIGMLAEERRSRMGVLRALGLRRRGLVGLAVIEGAWYSLAAGVVGVVVGVGAGRFIAARFGRAFAEFAGEDFDFEFHYSLKAPTVVAGFAVGTFLTLLVVFFAARRTSRMTITAAIRNLPEPPAEKSRRPWPRRIRLAVFGLLGVSGIAVPLVVASVVKPRLSPRTHSTLLGLALAGLSFGMIAGQDPNTDAQLFFLVFVIAMLTAVFGLTILASANLHVAETVVGLLGKAFSGLRATLRPPLAYLARRPTRTGLTTGVFAVIVGMLSLFAVFFVIFRPSYERFGNGYDVRVLSTGSASISLPPAVRPEVARSISLPTLGYIGPTDGDDAFSDSERTFVPLFVADATVAGDPPVRLY